MKLGKLVVENFMSIKSASVDLSDRGLVLIQGKNNDEDAFESNGAGKSTLFSEAPTWAIFGETIRGQKGDSIINRKVGKGTRVSQQVIDGNDVYEIIRHRKHGEHGNHVLLFKNGNNITGKSDKDTNALIEDIIQMNMSTFTNSIMFGQGVSKMFATSTDAEQKKILEKMLQIDIFEACKEKAKEYVDLIKSQIKDTEGDITSKARELESILSSIEDLQNKEAELGEKITVKIQKLTDDLKSYTTELGILEVNDVEDASLYQGLVDKVNIKISKYKAHEDNRSDLNGDRRMLESNIGRLLKEIDNKEKELKDIQTNKNVPKSCDACGQNLPLGDTSHVENHLKDAIEKFVKEVEEKQKELEEIEGIIAKIDVVLEGKEKAEKQKEELQVVINEVNLKNTVRNNRMKELNSNIKRIEKEIQEQEELRSTTYTELIENNIKKSAFVNSEMEQLEGVLEGLKKDLDKYDFWITGFGNKGIKSVLLDSVTPFLNTRANHYLSKLTDSSILVKFDTQSTLASGETREKFSVEITNANGDDEYKGNSNGEKRRIDIAINMALQDLVANRSNKSMDFILYDEVFDGLDAVGCETVIELLQEKAKAFGTVMVITHNDNLKQLFNNSITVSKSDGKTEVY